MSWFTESIPATGPAARSRAIIVVGLLGLAGAAFPAGAAEPAGVTLSGAWLRTIVPSRPAAGYFILKNDSDRAQMLTGAASPACGSIMLHRSKSEGGVEKMMMVKQAAVPAHDALVFEPNGYHLMCMEPAAGLKPGQQVDITLQFLSGDALTGAFEVCGATGC